MVNASWAWGGKASIRRVGGKGGFESILKSWLQGARRKLVFTSVSFRFANHVTYNRRSSKLKSKTASPLHLLFDTKTVIHMQQHTYIYIYAYINTCLHALLPRYDGLL